MRSFKPQNYLKYALPLLLIGSAACGEAEPSAEEMINDANDNAAAMEQASAQLSDELRAAAAANGEMPCGLPSLPDASKAQPMNIDGKTYNTANEPEQVAAFYDAAAQARGGSTTKGGPPGMAEIIVTLGDAGTCRVVAQAQMTGGSNVQINKQ